MLVAMSEIYFTFLEKKQSGLPLINTIYAIKKYDLHTLLSELLMHCCANFVF